MNQEKVVDVRGQACPVPVVKTRDAMKENQPVTVLVSKRDQVENVERMAGRSGWSVASEDRGDHFAVFLRPGTGSGEPVVAPEDLVCSVNDPDSATRRPLVVIQSEFMGRGDDALGRLLMKAYLNTLADLDETPETIIFFNGGVKLAVKGSAVLDSLKALENAGVEILVCGTCLEFFGLKSDLGAGIISNMFDIAGTMMRHGISVLS